MYHPYPSSPFRKTLPLRPGSSRYPSLHQRDIPWVASSTAFLSTMICSQLLPVASLPWIHWGYSHLQSFRFFNPTAKLILLILDVLLNMKWPVQPSNKNLVYDFVQLFWSYYAHIQNFCILPCIKKFLMLRNFKWLSCTICIPNLIYTTSYSIGN